MMRPVRFCWILGLLLTLGAVAARPGQAYQWQITTPVETHVTNLQVADLQPGPVMKITWDYQPLGSGTPVFAVEKNTGGTWSSMGTTTSKFINDGAFSWNTTYQYRVHLFGRNPGNRPKGM